MDKPFVRSDYNYDRDEVSDITGLECKDESLTVQSEKDDADINVIVERFGITGSMPENPRLPQYLDLGDEQVDFQTAMNYVVESQEKFMELPAAMRARFDNDPQKLLVFLDDEANRAEAEKLGLVQPKAAAPAVPAPAAPAVPAAAAPGS